MRDIRLLSLVSRGDSSGIVPTGGSKDGLVPMIGLIPEVLDVDVVLLRDTSELRVVPGAPAERDADVVSKA